MYLPILNRDLWQLVTPEALMVGADMIIPGVPNIQRSNAAMPYVNDRRCLKRGEGAQLVFQILPTPEEAKLGMQGRMQRMWVAVAERQENVYVGILNVHPAGNYADRDFYLRPGAEIPFLPQHIVDITYPPRGSDIESVLQVKRRWSRDNLSMIMGDPVLNELLALADQSAVRELMEGTVSSAFGIGRTTGTGWTDKFITTGIKTQDGSEAFVEAVQPLQARSRQNTLLASAVCTRRQLQRASGETCEAIIIFLENNAGYSVYWFRTYRKAADGYEFDDLTAQFGDPVVFTPNV
jgi:hypothetical protein